MSDLEKYLYPPIIPYNTGNLKVSEIHTIYYEEAGNGHGVPAVFLHGGPGSGSNARDKRYFDPKVYRIVTFDQRGCGKSTPSNCLEENDTWSLIADMERLRKHLGIEKWLMFGGSWGSTLALLYAEAHIDRVLALVLRGIYICRSEQLTWIYKNGASFLYPDYWEEFVAPIPEDERGDLLSAYYNRLNGNNKDESIRCAKAFCIWETCFSRFIVDSEIIKAAKETPDEIALERAKFILHFEKNMAFLETPNQILYNAGIIRDSGIPVTIVQGRYDTACPAKTAWELHKILSNSELHLVENAGHSVREQNDVTRRLVEACDKYKDMF